MNGRDNFVGIVTHYGLDSQGKEFRGCNIFGHLSDRPWGSRSLLHNGHRVIPVGKRPGLGVNHPPPSRASDKKSTAIILTPIWAYVICSRVNFTFAFCI